jgi:ferric-dicitrate binding protein FerR (iron transport regulator)
MKIDPKDLDDFLVANDFATWVRKPTKESNAFWQNWIAENPEHQQRINEMRLMLLMMNYESLDFGQQEEDALWKRINQKTALQVSRMGDKQKKRKENTRPFFTKNYMKVAATLTILILVGIVFWFFLQAPQKEYVTGFGETKSIVLPDGSQVILNSNSHIKFVKKWATETDREVFLKGEAFFKVREQGTTKKSKFTVHTDGLDVEVLGTEFNVNSYRKKTKVVLQSGKIKLIQTRSPQKQEVIMKPGEIAQFDVVAKTLKVQQVKTELYTSWKDRKLIFDGTSLRDIAHILEDTYGIKVVLVNKELAERQVTGEIPIKDKELLFKALAMMYNLQIEIRNDSLVISNR